MEILQTAESLVAGPERDGFLAEACAGDPELKNQVISLLQSHESAGDFLVQTVLSPSTLISEEPGTRIGRYQLLEKLGEGGCGAVYVAEQIAGVRRRVALKVIKFGMDTRQVIARFEAERQALALMDHPNIAKVLDAGSTETGRPYFVMELVRGVRITQFCNENQLSTRERLDLFIKVCQAIQHAHQKSIIHRDIKPSNILVTLHDSVPVPKVIDFGIAKAIEGKLTDAPVYTQLLHFVGTPAYMSPEQAEMSGLDIDTRSDIYSLGVLLYELLTGQTPFDGQKLIASGIDAMRKTIREEEPVHPSTRISSRAGGGQNKSQIKNQKSQIPSDLDWIAMKCLEKDRTRRYETANALAADLQRHLSNQPIVARPPSTAYILQKAWRRNKIAWMAAAAVSIALVLGISLTAWQAFQANHARNIALAESQNARAEQSKAQKAEQAMNEALRQAEHHLYVANMNLAGQAWDRNNFMGLREVLEDTRSSRNHGFEWYYWQRQAHLNLRTFRGHAGRVNSVMFSPDGQRLVTGGEDKSVMVWNVATGQRIFNLNGHTNWVNCVAFSPDGQQIVSASRDHTVRFWDAATGAEIARLQADSGSVRSVAYSRDGQRIVTAGDDLIAKVWDSATRGLLFKLIGHTKTINCASFSPDGKAVLTGADDQTARVWEIGSGKEPLILRHEREVIAALFSPNGQTIISGGAAPVASMWNATTGEKLPALLEASGTMTSFAISSDGQHIMSGSWDSTARVWNATNRQVEQIFIGHVKGVFGVAISPTGTRVATAANEGSVKLWEAGEDRSVLKVEGMNSQVLAVALSSDGERIATASGMRDLNENTSGTGDQAAQVWDAKSKTKRLSLIGHKLGVSAITFSPDGSLILTGSGDKTAKLWDAATGKVLHTFETHASVNSVAFFPDGAQIVTAGQDLSPRVWDTATGRELFRLVGHTASVVSVVVSPDGRWILTGGWDTNVMVWEAHSGQLKRRIETPLERIRAVAFSPDSRSIAAGGWGSMPMLWDLNDAGREPILFKGHQSVISSIAFSPDGRQMVTGSFDATARLWEIATGREMLLLSPKPASPINSVAFSLDGQRIIISSSDQTVRIWEAATFNQVTAWEQDEQTAAKASAPE